LPCALRARRRVAVRFSAFDAPCTSPITAASALQRAPSSMAQSSSSSRRGMTVIRRAGSTPNRASPGPCGRPASLRDKGSLTHRTAPGRCAITRASNARAKPDRAPLSRPVSATTSCRAPSRRPLCGIRSGASGRSSGMRFVYSSTGRFPGFPRPLERPAGPCSFEADAGAGTSCVSEGRRPSMPAIWRRSLARRVRSWVARCTAHLFNVLYLFL